MLQGGLEKCTREHRRWPKYAGNCRGRKSTLSTLIARGQQEVVVLRDELVDLAGGTRTAACYLLLWQVVLLQKELTTPTEQLMCDDRPVGFWKNPPEFLSNSACIVRFEILEVL
jgi:hypothetical protein